MNELRRKPEVVVVTGASAGVGRATVQASPERGAHIGLIARGEEDWKARDARSRRPGGKALVLPTDVADADAVEAAAAEVEQRVRADRRLGQQRDGLGLLAGQGDDGGRVQARHRGDLSRLRLRHAGGAEADAAARPGRDRAGRLGARLPRHSAAGGVLRRASTRSRASPTRCAASCCTMAATCMLTMVQMPALNTPQFGWVKSRLPHKAQPVPPIYQPEVAAEAIYWAAHHTRREVHVGWSDAARRSGATKFAPGLLDHYLGRTGYKPPNKPTSPPTHTARKSLGAGGWRHGSWRTRRFQCACPRPQRRTLGDGTSGLAARGAGVAGVAGIAALVRRGK